MVSHDTICFLNANQNQVARLKVILKIFECIYGLNVNLAKSSIAGIGVDESMLHNCVELLGCKVET